MRLVLAATLAGNYGIYSGFEICEAAPVPGKEEYLNSEKYEIRAWDLDRPGNIRHDIRLMNQLRREHPALQEFANLAFYNCLERQHPLLRQAHGGPRRASCCSTSISIRTTRQGAHFEVPLWEFGLPDDASIEVEDLVTGHRFTWHGKVQHIWLDPHQRPYFIWRLISAVNGGS